MSSKASRRTTNVPDLEPDADDGDRRPARVEQPAGVARDEVVKLTRLELGVRGRIGGGLVDRHPASLAAVTFRVPAAPSAASRWR